MNENHKEEIRRQAEENIPLRPLNECDENGYNVAMLQRQAFISGAEAYSKLTEGDNKKHLEEIEFHKNQTQLRHKAYLEGVEEIKNLKERLREIHTMITGKDYHKIFDRIRDIINRIDTKK